MARPSGANVAAASRLCLWHFGRILSWALARRKIKTNPCTNGGKLNQGTRVDKIWSDEDVARFLRTAPSYLHLAMLLAINTGQRQGDLLRLLWSAYDGKEIKMRQRKTGAYVPIPVSDALKTALDAASRKSPIMLVNSDAEDDAKCQSPGGKPDDPAYVQCRAQLDAARTQAAATADEFARKCSGPSTLPPCPLPAD